MLKGKYWVQSNEEGQNSDFIGVESRLPKHINLESYMEKKKTVHPIWLTRYNY